MNALATAQRPHAPPRHIRGVVARVARRVATMLPRLLGPLLLAGLLLCPRAADAQSRFGLQLDVGIGLPLSASLHNVVSLEVTAEEGDTALGIPTLSRQTNRLGLHFALMAHLGTLEVRYALHRFAWNERLRDCVGDRNAQQLPNGEISDAEVRYQCANQPEREPILPGELAPLVLHHLGVGPRLYLRRRALSLTEGRQAERTARLYAIVAGGLSVAQYRDTNLGRVARAGGHLSLGAGSEVRLDRSLALTFDLRYTLSFVGASSAPAARSTRAIAAGRNVVNALLDVYHQIGLTAGIRFDVR